MDVCGCDFSSANGLFNSSSTDLTTVYNTIYSTSNNNYDFTSNVNSYYSNNSNIVNSNISNIYYILSNSSNLTNSNVSNIYYNYGIIDSNLGFYQLELFKTQLDVIAQKGQIVGLQTSDTIQSGSITAMSVTQIDHGTRITNLENNTYNKSTTDTLISNSSNSCYSNASNLSLSFSNNINTNLNNNLFTRSQLSNIFVTSNVLSNTSNTLADYNNLYNKPNIYTTIQTSNIFVTSNVLSNTSNFIINYNNLINLPSIYTRNELSNIFVTSNVLNNTSNNCIDFSKVLSNNCIDFSKVLSNNCIDFSKVLSNNIKTDINTSITTLNLDVNKSYDFTFSDSILHVGNNLCIRNINPAYGTFFNEMSLCLGIGNASLINLIPFFNNIVVSSSPEFSGLKIHRNGIVLLNSSNNLIINTLDDVQINGANILFSGKLNFGGTVGTKAPRYFTTNRTASFGGINCLAYDIDLDLYTRKETIGFYEQRHFKIKFIFGNGRIDYQWAPKEMEVGLSTYNGLSAFSYDTHGTNSLDYAVNYDYFLYKQTIDRITFCIPTAMFGTNHLTIYFIVQDYLAL